GSRPPGRWEWGKNPGKNGRHGERVAKIDHANHPAAELPVGRKKNTVEVRSWTEQSQRQEQQIKHIARRVDGGLGHDRIGNGRTVVTPSPGKPRQIQHSAKKSATSQDRP